MMPVDASQYYSTGTLLWSIKHHAWVHSILVSMFTCRQKYSDIHCICMCCLPRGNSGYYRSFIHILWGIVNQSTFIPDQIVRTMIHLDEIIICVSISITLASENHVQFVFICKGNYALESWSIFSPISINHRIRIYQKFVTLKICNHQSNIDTYFKSFSLFRCLNSISRQ